MGRLPALHDTVKVTESQGARWVAGDVPVEVPMRESSRDTPCGNWLIEKTNARSCARPLRKRNHGWRVAAKVRLLATRVISSQRGHLQPESIRLTLITR